MALGQRRRSSREPHTWAQCRLTSSGSAMAADSSGLPALGRNAISNLSRDWTPGAFPARCVFPGGPSKLATPRAVDCSGIWSLRCGWRGTGAGEVEQVPPGAESWAVQPPLCSLVGPARNPHHRSRVSWPQESAPCLPRRGGGCLGVPGAASPAERPSTCALASFPASFRTQTI